MDPLATDFLDDDDRDLALARSLDATGALRAGDAFEAALAGLRPAAAPVAAARAADLRARVLAATDPGAGDAASTPTRADRAPARHARTSRRVRPAVLGAVLALVLAGLGWTLGRRSPGPVLVAEATTAPVAATLPDGDGTAELAPGARLDALPVRGPGAEVRLRGRATFDVTHRPERRFAVATPAGTVAVLGTRFRVEATETRTTVTLERGSVRLESPLGTAVTLVPGQTATLENGRISTPAPADGVVAEGDADLTFRRAPAADVAAALARRTGLAVRLPDDVARETVSGTLALGTDRAALDAFADVLGGRFVPDGDRALRFERTR